MVEEAGEQARSLRADDAVECPGATRSCDDGAVTHGSTSRLGIVLGVLAAGAALFWLALHSKRAGPLRLRVTIARETSYLTGPLTRDGRVDYAAAWRAEHSSGVTPENNGAPLVFAALGLDESNFTEAECARVAMLEPHFTDFEEWAGNHEDLFPASSYRKSTDPGAVEQAVRALENGEDESEGAGDDAASIWFEEVGPSLDAVVRAMAMGRFFAPDASPFLDSSSGPDSPRYAFDARIGRALAWRALRRVRASEFDGASADLRAALEFAARLRSSGELYGFEDAVAREGDVWSCVQRIGSIVASPADSKPLGALLASLRAVRDPVPTADHLTELFRWSRMKVLAQFDSVLRGVEEKCAKNGIVHNSSSFDPDRIALMINRRFDEFDAVLAADTRWSERRRRLVDAFNGPEITKSDVALRAAKKAVGVEVGPRLDEVPWELFVSANASSLRGAVDGLLACTAEGDRGLVELAALVFAAKNGRDPSSSDDLPPDLVDAPWRDRITGSGVTFRRDADGRLVAQGPVVDFVAALDREHEEPAPEKK